MLERRYTFYILAASGHLSVNRILHVSRNNSAIIHPVNSKAARFARVSAQLHNFLLRVQRLYKNFNFRFQLLGKVILNISRSHATDISENVKIFYIEPSVHCIWNTSFRLLDNSRGCETYNWKVLRHFFIYHLFLYVISVFTHIIFYDLI